MYCRKSWQFRVLQFYCSILIWLLANVKNITMAPHQGSNGIHQEIIDPNNMTILQRYNLTHEQMERIRSQANNGKKDNSTQREVNLSNIKEFRINDIRHRVESALNFSNNEETPEHPLHEMAAYPICNADSDESSWLEDNNVTIRFSSSFFDQRHDHLNLESAILRLYKLNPKNPPNLQDNTEIEESDENQTKTKRCVDPLDILLDSQIRVTVSIVQRRNKRERRKRICNTIMMNVSKTGWVEIDIKRAIYFWEHAERQEHSQPARQHIQVGTLLIEVHDEEERPLKPGHYFQPPKCDQAGFAIPWNYYGPHTFRSPFATNEVPRYPRLDVKLIGYASFAPKASNKQLHESLREDFLRQIYTSNDNDAEIDNETTLPSAAPIEPTANNLLSSPITFDLQPAALEENQQQQQPQHNHHKRHSMPQNHNCEHNHQEDNQQRLSIEHDDATTDERDSNEHSQHRHHRAHNHHQHSHHHNRNHHHQHHQQRHHRNRKYEQLPDVA